MSFLFYFSFGSFFLSKRRQKVAIVRTAPPPPPFPSSQSQNKELPALGKHCRLTRVVNKLLVSRLFSFLLSLPITPHPFCLTVVPLLPTTHPANIKLGRFVVSRNTSQYFVGFSLPRDPNLPEEADSFLSICYSQLTLNLSQLTSTTTHLFAPGGLNSIQTSSFSCWLSVFTPRNLDNR